MPHHCMTILVFSNALLASLLLEWKFLGVTKDVFRGLVVVYLYLMQRFLNFSVRDPNIYKSSENALIFNGADTFFE